MARQGVHAPRQRFQFTPLREGRHIRAGCTSSASAFQFTPLREGRPAPQRCLFFHLNFNSRPSARGDSFSSSRRRFRAFQFTPLREGRQALQAPINRVHGISIHAPPRGATFALLTTVTQSDDFNSRPSARGDGAKQIFLAKTLKFQFTPLREGRRVNTPEERKRVQISIHAPPRGATWRNSSRNGLYRFQFTPLREGRLAG